MSTAFDKNTLPEFDSIKSDDEEILWLGKPVFIPYILRSIWVNLFTIAFGVIWIVGTKGISNGESDQNSWTWLFGLLALIHGGYMLLYQLFSFPNTAYGYSNRRVMMRTGFIGTDFKTIEHAKISEIEVNVNMFERWFNVGTIRFFSGQTETDDGETVKLYDGWISVKDPYTVFKMVKQASIDV